MPKVNYAAGFRYCAKCATITREVRCPDCHLLTRARRRGNRRATEKKEEREQIREKERLAQLQQIHAVDSHIVREWIAEGR